jgi:hypothetical protein
VVADFEGTVSCLEVEQRLNKQLVVGQCLIGDYFICKLFALYFDAFASQEHCSEDSSCMSGSRSSFWYNYQRSLQARKG